MTDISVRPGHDQARGVLDISIRLVQDHTDRYLIRGRVSDDAGEPIADVSLAANGGAGATTDASGAYTLTGLISDTYVIRPSKDWYAFTPPEITIELNRDRKEINFRGHSIGCARVASEPFLQFPLADYQTSESFSSAARDTDEAGLLSSWFDHHLPTYTPANNDMRLFTGKVYTESKGAEVWGGLYCWGDNPGDGESALHYCYDNHNGYDIVRPSSSDPNPIIYAAAEGTVVATCASGSSVCKDMTCGALGKQVWLDHGNN